MRKIALVLTAILGMTSVAQADWNGHRHNMGGYRGVPPQHHHYHNRGGDAGAALFGGLVGGLIIGGMINNMNQPRYQQQYYQDYDYYQPVCRRVYAGSYFDGFVVQRFYRTVCE